MKTEDNDQYTREEFIAVLRATAKGIAKARGIPASEVTEEECSYPAMAFLHDINMARLTEGFLELIMREELLITGIENGEATFDLVDN